MFIKLYVQYRDIQYLQSGAQVVAHYARPQPHNLYAEVSLNLDEVRLLPGEPDRPGVVFVTRLNNK